MNKVNITCSIKKKKKKKDKYWNYSVSDILYAFSNYMKHETSVT